MKVEIVDRVDKELDFDLTPFDLYRFKMAEKIKLKMGEFKRGKLHTHFRRHIYRYTSKVGFGDYSIALPLYSRTKVVMPGEGYVEIPISNYVIDWSGHKIIKMVVRGLTIPISVIVQNREAINNGFVCIDYWYAAQVFADHMNQGAKVVWNNEDGSNGNKS